MAQLRGAPIFVRNGHRRPQDGLFDARQSPPSRKPRRGSIARLRQNLRKPHIADALSFQNSTRQYAHAREAGIRAGIHEIGGRNQTTARFPQAWLLMCNESAKKHNNGGRSEF